MVNKMIFFVIIVGPLISILGLILAIRIRKKRVKNTEVNIDYSESGFTAAIEGFVGVVNSELPDVISNLPKDMREYIKKRKYTNIREDLAFYGDKFATTEDRRELIYKSKGKRPDFDVE